MSVKRVVVTGSQGKAGRHTVEELKQEGYEVLRVDVAAPHCVIAAADTVMDRPSGELMAEIYPDVPIRKKLSTYETLLSIDRAQEELGYEPQFS